MNSSEGVPSPSNQIGEENIRHTDETVLPDFIGHQAPDVVVQDTGLSNQAEMHELRHSTDNSPEDILDVEVMRDAAPDSLGNPPLSPSRSNEIAEPQASLDQIMNEKETLSPIIETNLNSGGQTPSFQPSSGPQASVGSLREGLLNDNVPVSFGKCVIFHLRHESVHALLGSFAPICFAS